MRSGEELVERLAASVGPAIVDDPTLLPNPPEPRETWVQLQHEVITAAAHADPSARAQLAKGLLYAILDQPSYGVSNPLADDAFELILQAAPDELAAALDREPPVHQYGGRRYLHWHLWVLPGTAGAHWLDQLARRDPSAVGRLLQDMLTSQLARLPDKDWPDRIDVLASLPRGPRPWPVEVLPMIDPPASALPALVRLAIAHATDERDHLLRSTATHLRRHRTGSPRDDCDLIDWQIAHTRPSLFRWLLELAGEPGQRQPLVREARRRGQLTPSEAARLGAGIERPAWADGDVPWMVHEVVAAGHVRAPHGRLAGGDPWWTGGYEGFPWVVELAPGSYPVDVVVAAHPLFGRECAALRLKITNGDVVEWTLLETDREAYPEGYVVEVGVASFGSVAVYNEAYVTETDLTHVVPGAQGAWESLDGGDHGSLVMCTVGPQHQQCRTWLGYDHDGHPVALITDLGLLEPNPQLLFGAA